MVHVIRWDNSIKIAAAGGGGVPFSLLKELNVTIIRVI